MLTFEIYMYAIYFMKRITFVLFVVLLMVSCGKNNRTYHNNEYGFSIEYPDDWDTSKTDPRMELIVLEPYQDSTDIFQEGYSISVFENEGYSLDEIVSENIAMTERYYNGAKIDREDILINEVDAIQLTLNYESEELSLTNVATFINHDKHLITITQSAEKSKFEQYKDLFQDLIQTFSITEK